MSLFERYLLAGFDPSQLTRLQLHRVRSISGSILGLSGIALFFLVHSILLGLPVQASALLVGFALGIGGYVMMARTGRIQYAGHALTAALVVVLVSQAFVTGGFRNPQFAWFLVAPLIAGSSLGLREGVLWGAVSAVCIAVFWGLDFGGVTFENLVPVAQRSYAEGFTLMGALAATLTVMTSFLRGQHYAESALLETNESLRHEVEVRAQAELEAKRAAESRSNFLATISHEIRTPLNGVLGMTSLLLDTELTSHQRECAETARRSGDALLTIIQDVLDFSKVDAGKLVIESAEFHLRDAVEDVVSLVAESAHAKDLELIVDVDPRVPSVVASDAGRIRQVLLNLLSNAIKFTAQGSVRLVVSATDAEGGDARLLFEVHDTGIGVAPEHQERLFEPFVQADSTTTRTFGGTGLGLSIVRRLSLAMGGDSGVSSRLGEGSCFWASVRTRVIDERPTLESTLLGTKVLVVAREPALGASLLTLLGTWGCMARSSEGGEAVHAELAAGGFDVVLVDADARGGAAEALVRRSSGSAHTGPAVVVLAPVAGAYARVPEWGALAAGWVTKPPRRRALEDALRRAITRAQRSPSTPSSKRALAVALSGRVLVVEDNLVNQQVVRMMLTSLGIEADVAANGQEALGMAARGRYAAILMDCQMPVMDGFEATRRLREGGDKTAIIAVTANAMQGDRERVAAAGMDDYLSKPISLEALRVALAPHCAQPSGT